MRLHVGTSGFSYKEWKGTFYPEDLPQAKMLAFYSERFTTVEINNTFYRMPVAKGLSAWADQVPDRFRFVLKAPQRITHQKKLLGAEDDVRQLLEAAAALGPHLGPILFQLPPFLRADATRLETFLAAIPSGTPVAFEFRHASWSSKPVEEALARHGAALCIAETDEGEVTELPASTTSWGYIRLRRAEYAESAFESWCAKIASQPWQEAWVFFKHEDEGKGPAFADRFKAIAEASGLQLA